jgi:hypothetical protein
MSGEMKKRRPINIVPLKTRPAVIESQIHAEAIPQKLVFHGGPLLTSVEIFTVFWGEQWKNNDRLQLLPDKLNEFFKFIVDSKLIDQMGEFSVVDKEIGHGKFVGTIKITSPSLEDIVSDEMIQDFLRNNINSKTIPAPTDNMLFFVYLPPGITSSLPNPETGGSDLSCEVFCGYHGFFKLNEAHNSSKNVYYAVMPFPDCGGCHVQEPTDFDALTVTSSHELCEAITDPEINATTIGTGWFVDPDGSGGPEIGDICNTTRGRIGGFLIQKEFSNQQKRCILNT